MKRIVCLTVLFSVTSAWCAFSWSAAAVVEPAGRGSDDNTSTAAGDKQSGRPVDILRGQVREHLRAGRIEAALASAQQSLARFADDQEVREECISLHLSLARGLISEEDFATADRALRAVLKIEAEHAEARRLVHAIDRARSQVPGRVKQARDWIGLEWFEPAFNTLRQAGALLPNRRGTWARAYREAAIGAGDDHYFTKTFHEAFYYYDAAMRLGEEQEIAAPPDLVSRWMQSMVFALAADVQKAEYPPAYWKMTLRRSEGAKGSTVLRTLVRAMAYENLGLPEKAASEYAKVLGRPVVSLDATIVARSRAAALDVIRGEYDAGLSHRRRGIWSDGGSGDWQVLEGDHFRVYHHNAEAARRVIEALRFHCGRIAGLLAMDLDEIPWSVPCDVYLYRDGPAFQKATDQPEHVRGISIIRKRGDALEGHAIHVYQTDPLLLSSSLAHELSHLIVGAVAGYRPFSAVLDEGIALHIEPQCRQRQFARLFAGIRKPRGIGDLLKISEAHPPEPDFYAEAYRLLAVLLARDDMAVALEVGRRAPDRRELALRFRFRSGAAMEAAYRGRKK